MTAYRWLIIACWIVFIVYWAISAAAANRTVGGVWRGMIIRAVIALAAVAILRRNTGGALSAPPTDVAEHSTRALIGIVVCVLGLAFAIWARVHLGRNWGMPRAVKENPELVTSGPYAFVRHPIYTGMLVGMIGSAMVFGLSWLLLPVVSAAYFVYSAIEEQKLMLRSFPDSYPAYRQRTKMLIPFVL